MKLSLGISPCPNDTFIFDALLNRQIDTLGLEIDLKMADVEELNRAAFNNELDVTKLSYHAYAHLFNSYQILDSGSALGNGNGPLLISKYKIYPDEVSDLKIAIPGKYTTANMLLLMAFPSIKNAVEYLFSNIEEAILSNEVDAGVIIHENRFTYQKKGLKKIADLGDLWEKESNRPIPLGAIVIKRQISADIKQKFNIILKNSVEFALKNKNYTSSFITQNAQEMETAVIRQHINLYVNEFTLSLGEKGKEAVSFLYKKAYEKKIIQTLPSEIFL